MDLNKLRTFTVVAKHQSISRAAEQLYRTQPAISNQLRDLETELGLQLFERKHARIYLTREGERLYKDAKHHIGQLEDSALRLKDNTADMEGTIKIAVEHDTSGYLLPRIIGEFKQVCPSVSFEIMVSEYGTIDELLVNNTVDFALMVLYKQRDFFDTNPLHTFTRSLVASPSFLERSGSIGSISKLLECGLVSYSSELGDMRFWLKKNGYSKHFPAFQKRALAVVVHDAYTLNEMLFSGVGVGFSFDQIAAQMATDQRKLVTLFPEAEPIQVTVDLAQKKTRNANYLNETFHEFVLDNVERWKL